MVTDRKLSTLGRTPRSLGELPGEIELDGGERELQHALGDGVRETGPDRNAERREKADDHSVAEPDVAVIDASGDEREVLARVLDALASARG